MPAPPRRYRARLDALTSTGERAASRPIAAIVGPVAAAVEGAGSYAAARAALLRLARRPTPPALAATLRTAVEGAYRAGIATAADG